MVIVLEHLGFATKHKHERASRVAHIEWFEIVIQHQDGHIHTTDLRQAEIIVPWRGYREWDIGDGGNTDPLVPARDDGVWVLEFGVDEVKDRVVRRR